VRATDADADRFRATFEQAPVGIAHLAMDGRCLDVNQRLCDLLGFDHASLLAGGFHDVTHPDDLAADRDLMRRLRDGEIPSFQVEKRCLHRAGHPLWTMVTMSLVRAETGQPSYCIAVVEDISGRKRVGEALRASEAGLREAQAEILERLAQAAELRDDDTGLHTRRVGVLAARIATTLGLPSDEVELLRQAAPLHDVGKIGIPDHVLLKEGPLTPAERACIELHAALGARILSGSTSPLIRLAERIAHCHHERWDGTGYPRRLAAEAIPLPARICTVADVFDALSHARPYRAAWPMERIFAYMRHGAGSHFDPQVVDAFLRIAGPQLMTTLGDVRR
jgi:PAS domain S-box-containing protein